ncbi:MAG: hypothetical protein JW855_05215 [Gammaproteobacteria bacterium]|nr:hypothetical protein [Gammaproteobacteria bacterium]
MKKTFKKETQHYQAPAPETPYQKAQQEWDARLGNAAVQAKNWRFAAILSLLVSIVLLVMLIASFSMNQNHVFVAEVTKGGRIVNVAPLEVSYQPSQAQQEYFLGRFIKLIRGVPLDPVLAKQNWLEAYQFLTQRSSEQLNRILQKNNPLDLLGKKTVSVNISDMNLVNENTLEVDWVETIFDVNGQQQDQKRYSGIFTLMVKQPTTQKMIMQNPLGIYIVDFNMSLRNK